jgi:hypothetical protein
MITRTDSGWAPWWVVPSNDKKRARINCIAHLLSQIPWQEMPLPAIEIPDRQVDEGYVRPPQDLSPHVPDHAATLLADAEE